MALTVAQIVAWRDSLIEGRLSGVRRYKDQNGEEVEFRSDGEIAKAIAAADSLIASLGSQPIKTLRFNTSKGL